MDTTLEVFDVKEHEVSEASAPSFPTQAPTPTGFPAPKKRVSAFKQKRQGPSANASPAGPSSRNGTPLVKDTKMDERRGIDRENKAVLDAMSPEEIAEAQRELRHGLEPKFLQMLLRRATLNDEPTEPSPFDVVPSEIETSSSAVEPPPPPGPPSALRRTAVEDAPEEHSKPVPSISPDPVHKPKKTVTFDEDAPPPVPPPDLFPVTSTPLPKPKPANDPAADMASSQIHFPPVPVLPELDPSDPDFLETFRQKFFPSTPFDPSRLAWMAPIPTAHSVADRQSPYYPGQDSLPVSALRFDFRGNLIPPSVSRTIPVTEGLHHHGEAPEAAGYTIPELAGLMRSAVPSQRCLAHQTMGRILFRLGRGQWGAGVGGRDGDEDDLAFALWRCIKQTRVLESLEEEAGKPEGQRHMSCWAYACEALWLYEKSGWKEKWRGV